MDKSFVYGMFVDGDNFTDRVKETRRLKMDFENGVNVILISPRRMGKTSLVKHVHKQVNEDLVKVVYMDIYDCRSEYDFYNRFAEALMRQTASQADLVMKNIKDFLVRISPKITFSPDPVADYSLSLGITPKDYAPEEILSLPEVISQKTGRHIVVCIDEFQQVGEFPDSLTVQKRMRGVWQLQRNVSYCLFGSKKHLLTEIFQSKRMPFYQFGDTIYLEPIPTEDWVPFICSHFAKKNKTISTQHAARICEMVHNHSSYVQQLAWNVLLNTETEVTDEILQVSMRDLIHHNTALFMQQIDGLTTYQMNFLRAVAGGVHKDFTSQDILESYNLGTKSNVTRLISVLTNKELIERRMDGIYIADPVLDTWLRA
ncbi:MAG: ATP-binding protein [Paludibacteraceae bacterium]|nr:ATP-binding protein [Paludibacteraceae bacterium]